MCERHPYERYFLVTIACFCDTRRGALLKHAEIQNVTQFSA